MGVQGREQGKSSDRMSDTAFRIMQFIFAIIDFLSPYLDRRIKRFGIKEGTTIVDYGCGPGRYAMRFSRLVGETGKVYTVDIHELAIEAVKRRMARYRLQNIVPVLAHGYNSGLPDHTADVVLAIDMFFSVKTPTEFLGELRRIAKKDGLLIIDDGHQSREVTKRKIFDSGCWTIVEETRDHLKCVPAWPAT